MESRKTFSLAPARTEESVALRWYPTVYTETFFREVAKHSGLTIRLEKHRGDNAHHIVEATFKSFARCLRKFMDEIEGNDGSETACSDNSSSRAKQSSEKYQRDEHRRRVGFG